VFEWSWRLLGVAERQVFAQLAVFRGGFTRSAAHAVAGASPAVLNQLVQKALVRVRPAADGPGRYKLHELLRQFALEQLSANPAAQTAVMERHAAFYIELAERRRPEAMGLEEEGWHMHVAREYDNLRAALSWAQTQPVHCWFRSQKPGARRADARRPGAGRSPSRGCAGPISRARDSRGRCRTLDHTWAHRRREQ
jgi:predicted ATPase